MSTAPQNPPSRQRGVGVAAGVGVVAPPQRSTLRAAGRRLDTGGHQFVTLEREPNGSWKLNTGPRGVRLEARVMVTLCRAVLYYARQGGTR